MSADTTEVTTPGIEFSLAMAVNLSGSGTNLALHVELTSKLTNNVTISKSFLPWGGIHGMVLVATTTISQGELLPRTMLIDDPSLDKVILKPGDVVRGVIPLKARFPNIYEKLQKSDVIVFWSYQMRPREKVFVERHGGWLLILRKEFD